jgi:hypothetical protein
MHSRLSGPAWQVKSTFFFEKGLAKCSRGEDAVRAMSPHGCLTLPVIRMAGGGFRLEVASSAQLEGPICVCVPSGCHALRASCSSWDTSSSNLGRPTDPEAPPFPHIGHSPRIFQLCTQVKSGPFVLLVPAQLGLAACRAVAAPAGPRRPPAQCRWPVDSRMFNTVDTVTAPGPGPIDTPSSEATAECA